MAELCLILYLHRSAVQDAVFIVHCGSLVIYNIIRRIQHGRVVRRIILKHQELILIRIRNRRQILHISQNGIGSDQLIGISRVRIGGEVAPLVIDHYLHKQRSCPEQAVNHEIVLLRGQCISLQFPLKTARKLSLQVIGTDIWHPVIDGQIRRPFIVGIRRVAHGNLIAVLGKKCRHQF